MKKVLTVKDEDQIERRIDNYILSQIKGVPKSLIHRLIRQGHIRVNKKRVKSSYRIQLGDEIRLPDLNVASQENPKKTLKPSQSLMKVLKDCILFENDSLLILNKPSGLSVHGGSRLSYGLIETLRMMRPEAHFLELAHRLDRETSGCLVIAKRRDVLRKLHELLRQHKIYKIYQALTYGHWKQKKNIIKSLLKKNNIRSGERKVLVMDSGKEAISEFNVVKKFNHAELVQVKIETGRTHQIRVHAAQNAHPIAGDKKYGDHAFNNLMKQKGLKRLFLHASQISFLLDSKRISVKAALDKELLKILSEQ